MQVSRIFVSITLEDTPWSSRRKHIEWDLYLKGSEIYRVCYMSPPQYRKFMRMSITLKGYTLVMIWKTTQKRRYSTPWNMPIVHGTRHENNWKGMKTSIRIQYWQSEWNMIDAPVGQPFLLTKGNCFFHAHTFTTNLSHAAGCLYWLTAPGFFFPSCF